VLDNKRFLQGDVMTATYNDLSTVDFGHRFTQINDPVRFPTTSTGTGAGGSPITYTSGVVTLTCAGMRIEDWHSHIKGYFINETSKAKIAQSIRSSGGLVFPSQQVFQYNFNKPPNAAGLSAQQNIALYNTHSILVAYPKTPNQVTVFENPCQTGVYLKVNSQQIPNDGYDTTGVAHLQDQIDIASLDGPLNPSSDFENSIILEHSNQVDGTRYNNCLSDDTAYLAEFSTEHFDQAFIYDGLHSEGQNHPIELVGAPKYSGANDTYYIPDPAHQDQKNNQFPLLLECRDTFLVLNDTGLHYINESAHGVSQA
jgi:hypothetical protein